MVRSRRMGMSEHSQAIDYVPINPGDFRVFETTHVHCILGRQKHTPHPPPLGDDEDDDDDDDDHEDVEDEMEGVAKEEEKKEERVHGRARGSLDRDYPLKRKRMAKKKKKKKKKKKGTRDNGPGLVFVRDMRTCIEVCGNCVARVLTVGGSLGGKVEAGQR